MYYLTNEQTMFKFISTSVHHLCRSSIAQGR